MHCCLRNTWKNTLPCLVALTIGRHQICTELVVGGIARLTLRDAMLACAVLPWCAGISVDLKIRVLTARELIRDDGHGVHVRRASRLGYRTRKIMVCSTLLRKIHCTTPIQFWNVEIAVAWLGADHAQSWLVTPGGEKCMCKTGACNKINANEIRSYEFTYSSKPSPIPAEFNASALHKVQYCSTTVTQQGNGVVFLKNSTASQQDRVPIPDLGSSSKTSNPSFPGMRNDRGLGYEQGLAVGQTIKISFMPDRQPSCEEMYFNNDLYSDQLLSALNCYRCFRNQTDCGDYFADVIHS